MAVTEYPVVYHVVCSINPTTPVDPAGAGPTAIVAGNGSDFDADQSRGVYLVPVIGSASLSWRGTVKFKGLMKRMIRDFPSPDGPLSIRS